MLNIIMLDASLKRDKIRVRYLFMQMIHRTVSGLKPNMTAVTTGAAGIGLLSLSRRLGFNLLTELPVGVFNGLGRLEVL